ncbi:heterogeneous nuclear ribonucleoprotein M isoform X4 [Gallus gallus]|uniref:heterogeneous nuclear ribonucleoprotein M isoform X4 n=3 Tax=Phasianidae TaxID=9005 RepID=UPI000739E964|nr:heterogeneous nuclear ribonucleoprotein M isoform X4 [Gallus gallus]XP_046789697.1 heterogeneous nuclear ribonucleoprotein M isoform X4 [Gallus gallus]
MAAAAAVAAATESAGGKMEEPPAAAAPPPPNGAGGAGDPPAKSEGERPSQNEKRKEKSVKRGGNRFEPYANPAKRYRAFITNIPFDVKWQSLKDLVKEKVGEVTYVELLMDAEGKSRGCAVVEFKMEESMKKAAEVLNKHSLGGRPLKVKEQLRTCSYIKGPIKQKSRETSSVLTVTLGRRDPDGEHARRAMQKVMAAGGMGIGPGPGGPGMINIPPSILNNPNIPNEIIHALQAGRLGSTVFVANLDYKVGWKKLKEVFSMAGAVVRADILEDKDGKSRGIGTVTFEQAIEAVQAISMFNGQLLFDRPMHVKMDERAFPKGDFFPPERPQQLPRMGMEGMGFGMNKMGGMEGPFGGMENIGRFPAGMNMGRMSEMDRAMGGGFEREFGRNEMGMSRSFGETLERGIGGGNASIPGIERMAPGIDRMGSGIERIPSGMGHGMERVGSEIDRMGLVLDRMSSNVDRIGSGIDRMAPLGIDHIAPNIERMGPAIERMGSGIERMGSGIGFGIERMGAAIDRVGTTMDRMGSGVERMGSGMDRMGIGMERMVPAGMGTGMGQVIERMPAGLDRIGATPMERIGIDRMGAASMERMGLERIGATNMERMGPAMGQGMGAGIDRMGLAMGSNFERTMEMERGNFAGNFAGSLGGTGGPAAGVARKACQIFVRNLPFDFTWKMLKDKFNECGHVLYADIKMENGKSKGCGVVRFESPEVAERACRMMNGIQLRGREIDVRIDRNA